MAPEHSPIRLLLVPMSDGLDCGAPGSDQLFL
jgi:hypothetical protein